MNITLDREMIDEAKLLGVNISRACEIGLAEQLKSVREAKWKAEQAPIIDAWNQWTTENGVPLSEFRHF